MLPELPTPSRQIYQSAFAGQPCFETVVFRLQARAAEAACHSCDYAGEVARNRADFWDQKRRPDLMYSLRNALHYYTAPNRRLDCFWITGSRKSSRAKVVL